MMGSERTWTLAVERTAYRERTFPAVPGMNADRANGENISPGLERTSGGQRKREFTSSAARYRNVRPWTKGDEWSEGENREHYCDALAPMVALASKGTGKWRELTGTCATYLAERNRDERLGDVPAARFAALRADISKRAEFLAGVTTGNRDGAARMAQMARNIIG